MKTAIITGVTGQDGAYLSRLLLEKGYRIIGLTRSYNTANIDKLIYLGIRDKITLEECDLTDISSIINIFNKYHPDEIYNLASQSSVGLSFNQPIGTIHFNILSVINLLESIKMFDKKIKFYQASSSEMFGKVKSLPVTEETPMHPLSPYAISKASAHWIVVNYRESYDLFACSGILFNHESYLRSSNFFVKKVIQDAVSIKKGKLANLRVGNLDIKRDFGYSPIYVEAIWSILQQPLADDFIVCSGNSVSLREIVHYVFKKLELGHNLIIEDKNLFRPADINDIYGDKTKAKRILNWQYNSDFFSVLDILIDEELRNSNDL